MKAMHEFNDTFDNENDDTTYFPEGEQGRCPHCMCKVVLPCLACSLRNNDATAEPFSPTDRLEPTLEIQLFGSELQRYRQVRRRREKLQQQMKSE